MAVAQHRAPIDYTVPVAWAAVLALVVGVVAGLAISLVTAPGQGLMRGIVLGLVLGIPAAVAVVFSRRAVDQGAQPWLVTALGLLALVLVAALLFALTQVDLSMAPIGGALGIATGLVSLGVGLWLANRPEGESRPEHRRH
ncbi:hypothetical protein [Agrococcus baldri]|uniref:Uncharacterized protein n=1 Tax=Agrococcus baldri TaxID=153730 RepID=A0AA87RLF2_9MICO|nr:hypothetical protein [Agrococcus baldri]GEK81168.1 hypothetical protein ABA31_25190 [Agrococcus baldri]